VVYILTALQVMDMAVVGREAVIDLTLSVEVSIGALDL